MCFSSYKNRKLKVKLWWVGAHERKKRAFFILFILSEGNFFNICVLSQCIVYWIHFQKIHIKKHYCIHTLLLLVFKIVERLQCILEESDKWRAQRTHVPYVVYVPTRLTCSMCSTCPRTLRNLRAHVPKYILQTGKLKNGNFVPIHFYGYWV